MALRAARRVPKALTRIKLHRQHASRALLAQHSRKITAPRACCVDWVGMHMELEPQTPIVRNARKAFTRTLEVRPTALAVLKARIKTQLVSLTALPVSQEATQTLGGRLQHVSSAAQEPTSQTVVHKLGAQNARPENTKTTLGRAYVLVAIQASIARIQARRRVTCHRRGMSPMQQRLPLSGVLLALTQPAKAIPSANRVP